MVPIDGPIREGVGLLGSPSFEIPRSVERDGGLEPARARTSCAAGCAAKNRHNLVTIGAVPAGALGLRLRGHRWPRRAAADLYHAWGVAAIAAGQRSRSSLFSVVYFVLVERAVDRPRGTGARRLLDLRPRLLAARAVLEGARREPYLHAASTARRSRPCSGGCSGVRIGRRVFDDGCCIAGAERSSPIGDDCTLNAGSIIQCHSQEDGAFKSDRTAIGAGCTLGVGAFVHYGVTMGDGAVLAADSFLMKGEEVPADGALGRQPGQRRCASSAPTCRVRPDQPRRRRRRWLVRSA